MPATTTESLRALLGPVVTEAGFDLEELTVTPAGRRRLLRVTVDGDGGIDLDAVAEISRVVSAALDDADAFGAVPYVLEVGSPGVERPLTEPRHWRRAVGRLVEVSPRADPSGRPASPVTARVVRAGETSAVLDVDGTEREVVYAEVARAQVQVEFKRPGDDGTADDPVDLEMHDDTADDIDDDRVEDDDETDDADADIDTEPDGGRRHDLEAPSDDGLGADRDEESAGRVGRPSDLSATGPAPIDRRG